MQDVPTSTGFTKERKLIKIKPAARHTADRFAPDSLDSRIAPTTKTLKVTLPPSPTASVSAMAVHVSVSLVGGLGNRMWQLQSAIGLAMRANGTVVVTHGDHSVLDEVFAVMY